MFTFVSVELNRTVRNFGLRTISESRLTLRLDAIRFSFHPLIKGINAFCGRRSFLAVRFLEPQDQDKTKNL
jgi:hypothetical protein